MSELQLVGLRPAQSRDRERPVQSVRHTHLFLAHQTLLSLQQGKDDIQSRLPGININFSWFHGTFSLFFGGKQPQQETEALCSCCNIIIDFHQGHMWPRGGMGGGPRSHVTCDILRYRVMLTSI